MNPVGIVFQSEYVGSTIDSAGSYVFKSLGLPLSGLWRVLAVFYVV